MALTSEIAQAYRDIGNARAGGAERAGQIYGSLAQYLGNVPNEVMAQRRQQQAQDQEQQIRAQQLQMGGLQLQQAEDTRRANGLMDSAAQQFGPDYPRYREYLAQNGLGHLLPSLDKSHAEGQKAIADALEAQDKAEASQANLAGLVGAEAQTFIDAGGPDAYENAAGHIVRRIGTLRDKGLIPPNEAAGIVAQIDPTQPDSVTGTIDRLRQAPDQVEAKRKAAEAAKAAIETKKAGLETQGLQVTQEFQAAHGGLTPEQQQATTDRATAEAQRQANEAAVRGQEAERIALEKQRVGLEGQRLKLSGGTGADPEAVAGYVRQVVAGDLPLQSVPARERDAVVKALASSGQNISKLTSQGKQMKETATTLLPLIDKVQSLATQLDQKGLLGTLGGRARNMAAVESAAANIQNLSPADRKLIGEFASAGGLLITGIARAHGGARAGGSSQMVAHLSKLMDAGNKDLPTFLGNLEGERDFMRAYSSMGEAAPAAAPASGVKVLSIVPVK